ncbi:hypothetical protein L9F63_012767, partial [Diploptera punctata]
LHVKEPEHYNPLNVNVRKNIEMVSAFSVEYELSVSKPVSWQAVFVECYRMSTISFVNGTLSSLRSFWTGFSHVAIATDCPEIFFTYYFYHPFVCVSRSYYGLSSVMLAGSSVNILRESLVLVFIIPYWYMIVQLMLCIFFFLLVSALLFTWFLTSWSTMEGLQRACDDPKYAYMVTWHFATMYFNRITCKLESIDEDYIPFSLSMIVKKNYPYTDIINHKVLPEDLIPGEFFSLKCLSTLLIFDHYTRSPHRANISENICVVCRIIKTCLLKWHRPYALLFMPLFRFSPDFQKTANIIIRESAS